MLGSDRLSDSAHRPNRLVPIVVHRGHGLVSGILKRERSGGRQDFGFSGATRAAAPSRIAPAGKKSHAKMTAMSTPFARHPIGWSVVIALWLIAAAILLWRSRTAPARADRIRLLVATAVAVIGALLVASLLIWPDLLYP